MRKNAAGSVYSSAAYPLVDQREVRRELRIGEARFEHVRVGFADFSPGAELLRRRWLQFQLRLWAAIDAVRLSLLLVERLNSRLLGFCLYRGEQLAHRVEVAQRLAGTHLSAEVRDGVTRIQSVGDEAACFTQLLVMAEKFTPVVEECFQQPIDVQFCLCIPAPSTARVVAPLLAISVVHVLRDVRPEA